MTKPSAVQVALAKRVGLPATASKDEVVRAALAKMAAMGGTHPSSDGRDICDSCDRWTHHGSGKPIVHSSRCDTPQAQPGGMTTQPKFPNRDRGSSSQGNGGAGPLNENEAQARDDGEWWTDKDYKRRRPGT